MKTINDSKHPYRFSTMLAIICSGAIGTYALSVEAAPPGPLPYGVYDPEGDFSEDSQVSNEHLFLPWEDVDLETLSLADEYSLARNRKLLVTIEPWTWTKNARNTPEALKAGISSGRYDVNMRAICDILATLKNDITVRWAHEMDDESGQFIWAGWNPAEYISAYRRMISICKQSAPGLKYMWSPLGRENLGDYFPGAEYVDIVGISVFGLQAWENEILGKEQTYVDVMGPRYARAAAFGLPVVVAELGYVGNAEYVAGWDNAVRQNYPQFPALVEVNYFNQKEVYPWPDNYGLPDWRVKNQIVDYQRRASAQ